MKTLLLAFAILVTSVPAVEAIALPRPALLQGQGGGPLARVRQRIQNIRQRIQERRAAKAAAQQQAQAVQSANVSGSK